MLLKHSCEWLILASCVNIVQMKVTLKLELHIVFFILLLVPISSFRNKIHSASLRICLSNISKKMKTMLFKRAKDNLLGDGAPYIRTPPFEH